MRNPDLVSYLLSFCTSGSGGCLLAPGKPQKSTGYHRMSFLGRRMTSHRALYIAAYGEPPDKLFVLHRCGVRACVNPAHLYAGTAQQNMDDMKRHGTSTKGRSINRGERNAWSKVTESDVRSIRSRAAGKEALKDIAKDFSISAHAVGEIVSGKRWGHVA